MGSWKGYTGLLFQLCLPVSTFPEDGSITNWFQNSSCVTLYMCQKIVRTNIYILLVFPQVDLKVYILPKLFAIILDDPCKFLGGCHLVSSPEDTKGSERKAQYKVK